MPNEQPQKDLVIEARAALVKMSNGTRIREAQLAPLLNESRELLRQLCDEVERLREQLAEARAAAFKDAVEIIDTAADGWSDLARARKSQTFSAYVIAALDLKGQLNQAAANSGEGVEDDGSQVGTV